MANPVDKNLVAFLSNGENFNEIVARRPLDDIIDQINDNVFSKTDANSTYLQRNNNLNDVTNPVTAFNNIKQTASVSSRGVVEVATTTEAENGTSNVFPDAAGVHAAFNKYGLGTNVDVVTDYDALSGTQFYRSDNAEQLSGFGVGVFLQRASGGVAATIEVSDDEKFGFRTRNSDGTWDSWREVWHSGNLENPMTLDTAQEVTGNKTFKGLLRHEYTGFSSASLIKRLDNNSNVRLRFINNQNDEVVIGLANPGEFSIDFGENSDLTGASPFRFRGVDGVKFGQPDASFMGAGTLNAEGLYVNGSSVVDLDSTQTISGSKTFTQGIKFAGISGNGNSYGSWGNGIQQAHSGPKTGFTTASFIHNNTRGFQITASSFDEPEIAFRSVHTNHTDGLSSWIYLATLDTNQTFSGTKTFQDELRLTGPGNYNTLRFTNSNNPYGSFWRYDTNSLFLMLTAENDKLGSYDARRPFSLRASNGGVDLNGGSGNTAGVRVGSPGGSTPAGTLNAEGLRVNGNPVWHEGNFNPANKANATHSHGYGELPFNSSDVSNWNTAYTGRPIGVSGNGNGTLTISRNGLGDLTTNLAHNHDASQITSGTFNNDRLPNSPTFSSVVLSAGGSFGSYSEGPFSSLVPGSSFGVLLTSRDSGHLVINIDGNDDNDSFSVVSGDGTPDARRFAVKQGGDVIVGSPGGSVGAGSLNAEGLFINGISIRSASTINSGVFNDARISDNIPRLNSSNTFAESIRVNGGDHTIRFGGSTGDYVAMDTLSRNSDITKYIDDAQVGMIEYRVHTSGVGFTNRFEFQIAGSSSGEFRATGNIRAGYSDGRLKDIVSDLKGSREAIRSWKTFKYSPNDLAIKLGASGSRDLEIGLDANDVNTTHPELTCIAPFDYNSKKGNSKSGKNYLTLKYDRVVSVLVAAVNEQSDIVDAQKEEISDLKTRLERLEQLMSGGV